MEKKKEIKKRTFSGVVVSDKMTDTIVVRVERYVKHPKYGKYIRRQKRYKVHSPDNTYKVGDKVTIAPSKPVSKDKKFIVVS